MLPGLAGDRSTEQAAHTPGPWSIGSDIHDDRIGIGSKHGVVVFAPFIKHADMLAGVQGIDNARLIAAAPDMLEALIECANRLRYDGDLHAQQGLETRRDASWGAMRMAEDAIAKATGTEPANRDHADAKREDIVP